MVMTDYLEAKTLNWALRGTLPGAAPATLYVALYTAAPTNAGGGTEPAGGNYARAPLAAATAFGAPTAAGVELAEPAIFPTPTGSWGDIVAWGILDAPGAGNLLVWDEFAAPIPIGNGDPAPEFGAGDLAVAVS